jgi:hypothetical protein
MNILLIRHIGMGEFLVCKMGVCCGMGLMGGKVLTPLHHLIKRIL